MDIDEAIDNLDGPDIGIFDMARQFDAEYVDALIPQFSYAQALLHNLSREVQVDFMCAVNFTPIILASGTGPQPYVLGDRYECPHCGALKWQHEHAWTSMCCFNGKKILPALEDPIDPDAKWILDLFQNPNAKGKLFRKFIRPLNNNLAMASQMVTQVNSQTHTHTVYIYIHTLFLHYMFSNYS